jgi:hypothetical protein
MDKLSDVVLSLSLSPSRLQACGKDKFYTIAFFVQSGIFLANWARIRGGKKLFMPIHRKIEGIDATALRFQWYADRARYRHA